MTETNTNLTNATFQYPVWANVQTSTDKYFITCACGDTNVRSGFAKYKNLFVYAETGDI